MVPGLLLFYAFINDLVEELEGTSVKSEIQLGESVEDKKILGSLVKWAEI